VKVTDLRGILQYIPEFREKTFIIAVDGGIVTDENFANILLDVAVLRSLNIRVVLVHGASAQIKALAEKQSVQASNLDGTGLTDAPTLQVAIDAANRLTHEIMEVHQYNMCLKLLQNPWRKRTRAVVGAQHCGSC
jgi:amino-acid N-acetyltransferase